MISGHQNRKELSKRLSIRIPNKIAEDIMSSSLTDSHPAHHVIIFCLPFFKPSWFRFTSVVFPFLSLILYSITIYMFKWRNIRHFISKLCGSCLLSASRRHDCQTKAKIAITTPALNFEDVCFAWQGFRSSCRLLYQKKQYWETLG